MCMGMGTIDSLTVGLESHWPRVTDVYRLNGLTKGDEHPAYLQGVWQRVLSMTYGTELTTSHIL